MDVDKYCFQSLEAYNVIDLCFWDGDKLACDAIQLKELQMCEHSLFTTHEDCTLCLRNDIFVEPNDYEVSDLMCS
jgi:hypothetical protein